MISLASGRVVEIKAKLGDTVKKGQVLLSVQSSDISMAFSDYRKAVANESLMERQVERAQILYDKGAISLNDFQVAQDANPKARVDTQTAHEHLRVLGVDKDHPGGVATLWRRFRGDYRSAGDECVRSAGTVVRQSIHDFGFVERLGTV